MGIWAILPVKPLRRGKSRLASVMDELQRTTLNECLLEKPVPLITISRNRLTTIIQG